MMRKLVLCLAIVCFFYQTNAVAQQRKRQPRSETVGKDISSRVQPRLQDAKAYVDSIYRALPGQFDYRNVRYGTTLKSLIAADDAQSGGEVGAIDGVPFCQCQDTSGPYSFSSTVTGASATKGVVKVDLRIGGPAERFAIDVAFIHGEWVVEDIHSKGMKSLVSYLRAALRRPNFK